MENPMTRNLKLSSAAAYVKDMSSINGIGPIVENKVFTYVRIKDHFGTIPPEAFNFRGVKLCDTELDPIFTADDQLFQSLKVSRIKSNRDGIVYGNYDIEGNTIETDVESGIIELTHSRLRTDEQGYPVLPYHGSLMSAVENYIKFRYYSILNENGLIADKFVEMASREYSWYIGQYLVSEEYMPTYDAAVAWANSWQKLIDTGNEDLGSKSIKEFRNL